MIKSVSIRPKKEEAAEAFAGEGKKKAEMR